MLRLGAETKGYVLVLAVASVACTTGPRFARVEGAFQVPHEARVGHDVFDVLCSDMDLDGDPDVLVNWHHLDPLELFENRGGTYELLTRPRSGLYDYDAIPTLFADTQSMIDRVEQATAPGLYVWHGLPRHEESWQFAWKEPPDDPRGLRLEVFSNTQLVSADGLHEVV